jgi:DNA-binding NarL/FixJ family response regulator
MPKNTRCTNVHIVDIANFPLSLRELEVLQLLASGEPTKKVASLLGISPKTVETHRTKIIDRLNPFIDNGTRIVEFTHLAIALGLVGIKYQISGTSARISTFLRKHNKK